MGLTKEPKLSPEGNNESEADGVISLPLAKVDFSPRSFAEMVGQADPVRRLAGLIEIARRRNRALGHVLLLGPDGCGKRTTAQLIARELRVNLKICDRTQLDRPGSLAAAVYDLDNGDVLFIENINQLRKDIAELLLPALENFELNIMVGKGPGVRAMRLAVKPFTLIGTAERQSDCPRDLFDAFHAVFTFQPYSESELFELICRFGSRAGLSLEPNVQCCGPGRETYRRPAIARGNDAATARSNRKAADY